MDLENGEKKHQRETRFVECAYRVGIEEEMCLNILQLMDKNHGKFATLNADSSMSDDEWELKEDRFMKEHDAHITKQLEKIFSLRHEV